MIFYNQSFYDSTIFTCVASNGILNFEFPSASINDFFSITPLDLKIV
jgi:hypothetical protein